MVQAIPDMPPGTLGFRVSGRLTREDYVSVLVPPMRSAVEAGERLRVLYAIGLWRAVELFAWMVPGEMRMFHEHELEQAKAWLTEKP